MVSSIQQLKLMMWFQSLTLFIIPLILFIFFLYKWLETKSHSMNINNLPPSPPKLPIIGNLHQLTNDPHGSLRSLSEKYGELMLIHLGQSPAVVVSSARAASEIMTTHDALFSDRPISKTMKTVLYDGKDLVTAQYGEYWRQMKSICMLQILSNQSVRSFRSVREEEMNLLVEKIIQKSASSLPVNLTDLFTNLTNDVICRAAFRKKYSEKKGSTDFKKIMKELLGMIGSYRVGNFVPWLAWIDGLNGWDAKVDKLAKKLDQFLDEVVREHEDGLGKQIKDKNSQNTEELQDFVDVLLNVQNDHTVNSFPIERDGIKALILDMFAGGSDSSSALLEWAMTELIRHPKIMQEVQKEVRTIGSGKSYLNEDDLKQMKYLKAVIKETLRLHPSTPLMARKSAQDTKVSGFDIPAGYIVMVNIWAIQRDPTYWEEPENFNPSRFLNSSSSISYKRKDFNFFPFGGGRRICPGMSFAVANVEIVLANLMYKFDWTLPGGQKVETLDITSECIGAVVRRKTDLLAVATCSSQ